MKTKEDKAFLAGLWIGTILAFIVTILLNLYFPWK